MKNSSCQFTINQQPTNTSHQLNLLVENIFDSLRFEVAQWSLHLACRPRYSLSIKSLNERVKRERLDNCL
jgi:hypothetical protein